MTYDLYLVNPAEGGPAYFGLEVLGAWGKGKVARLADLSTTTVAAFAPSIWAIRICDERVQTVDLDIDAKYVGITGKISQKRRMKELADEFRRRGKTVIIGGSYASLSPDDVRPHADILVRGEIEEIAGELFRDLASGEFQAEYFGSKPDLKLSPIPRWDLYEKGLAVSAQVQTSRGCPFECEFCDVIQYLGRKQRWKEPEQILAELDVVYAQGYRAVFFADDNLTVMRRRTRAFLEALVGWNARRPAGRMSFSTQVSIDLAKEPELLELMRRAGFASVFIGVETLNEDSLAETGKRQNLRIDQVEQVERIVGQGIMIVAGIIVGFDHDGPDIFVRQAEFIQRMPVPLVSPGLLVAPDATPLHARMKAAGRLIENDYLGAGTAAATNIVPLQMSMAEMTGGMTWLLNRVFAPAQFGERVKRFVEQCGSALPRRSFPPVEGPFFRGVTVPLVRRLASHGAAELELMRWMEQTAMRRPELRPHLTAIFVHYCQARHMLEHEGLWDPALGRAEEPPVFAMREPAVA